MELQGLNSGSCFTVGLTQADGGQQTQAVLWRLAGGEERLHDVVCEGERDHSLAGGVDNQHRNPQTQKAEGGGTDRWGGGVNEAWQQNWARPRKHRTSSVLKPGPRYSKL